MSTDERFDRLLSELLDESTPSRPPDRLIPETQRALRDAHRRPRWFALLKEPPMRISSRVAVGSPTARLAAIVAATLLLAVMATGAVIAGSQLLAGSGVIVVAADGSGDHADIASAIEVAADGETILIMPGTYAAGATIDKDITLAGEGDREDVVLEIRSDGPAVVPEPDWAPEFALPYGLRLQDADAVVSGLTISGPALGAGVYVEGGSPVFEDLAIEFASEPSDDDDRVSFHLQGPSTPTIRGSAWDSYFAIRDGASPTIEDNVITRDGISIDGPGTTIVRGNTFLEGGWAGGTAAFGVIEDNEFDGTGATDGGGVLLDSASDMTIRNNAFHDFQPERLNDGAISITDMSKAVVEGNVVTDSKTGLWTGSGAQTTIRNNTLTGNGTAAILGGAKDSEFSGNTVNDNDIGLILSGSSPRVEANTIEGNRMGISMDATSRPTLAGNSICSGEINLRTFGNNPTTLDGNEVCADGPAG